MRRRSSRDEARSRRVHLKLKKDMTKIYEIQGKDRCRINLNYCGVKLIVDFKQVAGGQSRSRIVARDRFVQDALEHDVRYGSLYTCVQSFEENELTKEERVQEEHATSRAKKVTTVKSLNDALVWFSKKGETPTSDEEVRQLMTKYNVEFPAWKESQPADQ